MTLLGVFILIWGVFTAVNYFIGLAVEAMWGSGASLLAFLVVFFGSIVVSWHVAVRLTEPTTGADRTQ